MGHFLLQVRDGQTPWAIDAVRNWPQKDIVSHKWLKFPVLRNSRPKNGSFMVVSLANPQGPATATSWKKSAIIQLCTCLEKQQRWWGKVREDTNDVLVHLRFCTFCYVTPGVILSAASVHSTALCPHSAALPTHWTLLQCIFWGVEVLRKLEHKLGHILRISLEIKHITARLRIWWKKNLSSVISRMVFIFYGLLKRTIGQGLFVCVISFSAEQLHRGCCVSQLAKDFFFF